MTRAAWAVYPWRMPFAALALAVDNGTVLVAITLIVAPIAAVAFARSGGAWKALGKGPLAIDQDLSPHPAQAPPAPLNVAEQKAEVRQMLEAKAERLRSRGEAPIDVEAEMARLLAGEADPGVDDELRREVRQLVVIRNERRRRQGLAPLDVEAETDRQLADFIGSGR